MPKGIREDDDDVCRLPGGQRWVHKGICEHLMAVDRKSSQCDIGRETPSREIGSERGLDIPPETDGNENQVYLPDDTALKGERHLPWMDS